MSVKHKLQATELYFLRNIFCFFHEWGIYLWNKIWQQNVIEIQVGKHGRSLPFFWCPTAYKHLSKYTPHICNLFGSLSCVSTVCIQGDNTLQHHKKQVLFIKYYQKNKKSLKISPTGSNHSDLRFSSLPKKQSSQRKT